MIQIEWDIIEKKLQGKLTLEEERLFDTWRSETSVNDDYFRKIEKFYRENGFVKEVWDEDMEVSWDRLQGRLKRDLRPKRKLGWYWAASGVVACLVLGMVWFMMMRQQMVPERDSRVIMAGSAKAILTLSSGVQVELASDTSEIDEVAAKIVNAGREVRYEIQDSGVVATPVYNKVETPKGGEYCVTLAEGTKVYLGAMSSIRFPVQFDGEKRRVEVFGEAYFDVTWDPEHPFVVTVDGMEVEVLGTSFNVRSYADEQNMEVTLVLGKVKVVKEGHSCVLVPNEQAVWNKRTDELSFMPVDIEPFVAWKSGKLNIRNQRLEDILLRLCKWYDIQVFFVNEEAKDVRFYANMDRYGDLNELVKKFELTEQVRFEIEGNVVRVYSLR